jgi:hypothetical protein
VRLVPLITCLLVLAACGGGSGGSAGQSDYAEGLVSALGDVETPTSLDSQSLAALSEQYAQAAAELGGLSPPGEVMEAHVRMVTSMRAYADGLAQAAALTGDPVAFASEMSQANAHARAWASAFEEIRSRGYASTVSYQPG